jgi:NADPH:quinone reductase-like Zn-dependent oxidoreductase
MKIQQFTAYGGPERLQLVEAPIPTPKPEEILVANHASSVNPIDWKLHSGMLRWIKPLRFPATPLFDFAGTVAATGSAITGWAAGDRIFGMLPINGLGAAAEYLTVDPRFVSAIPPELDFATMAGLPLAGMTALQALRDQGQLRPGNRVLIIGGAGGVGHYAIQIARVLGAEVTALCGRVNLEFCRQLGAASVLDYADPALSLPEAGFDIILDCAGFEPISRWQPALGAEGRFVALLPSASWAWAAFKSRFLGRQRFYLTLVKSRPEDMAWLAEQVRQGALKTVVDEVFPLELLAAALRKSQGSHARGKIVITF